MALIQNLIARLRADTSQFDRNMKKSSQHMTRFGMDVKRMGQQLLAVAGLGGGIYALKRGLDAVTKAALIQEKAERDLMAATMTSIAGYKRFATEIQRLTVYGDEQVLTQMAYAKNLGVTNDKLEAATKAAVGLAAKFRLDLATSMMLVGRASQGQTQMLTRYGIVLEESLSTQEKFDRLLEIGASAFGLAEAEAQTAAGSIEQMKNAIGDTAETIGNVLLPSIQSLAREVTRFLTTNSMEIKRYVNDYVEGVGVMMRNSPAGLAYQVYNKLRGNTKEPIKVPSPAYNLPPEIEPASPFTKAIPIMKQYQREIDIERSLLGKVGEERKRAQKMIEYENKLKEAGIEKTGLLSVYTEAYRKQLIELGKQQRLMKVAEDIGDAFAGAFESMIFEAKKFGDVMKSLLKDIARSVFRNLITTPLANSITMALGGQPASVFHGGGIVGSGGGLRSIPAMAFAGAPRLHSGLMGDEFPAILQRGETVVPKGGSNAPTIIINNNTGQPMRQDGQPQFNGRDMVISIVADDYQRGGQLRKLFQK